MESVKKINVLSVTDIIANVHADSETLRVVYKQQAKVTTENWKDILDNLKIDPRKMYKEPPVCIEIESKGESSRLATFGNFSAIIGKAKSRKTFLVSLILGAAIKQDQPQNLIKVTLPPGKTRCVFFDTEQSTYDVWKVVKRILNTAETLVSDNFEAFGLRAYSPKERLILIQQFLYNNENIGLVVIDGIRDLVNDINSPEEATEITSHLLKWTEERDIHIITALHQNKGDNNARGHLGTEIVNKAETVISVEKDNDISMVSPEFVRGKDFIPFAFSIDKEGIPYVLEEWSKPNKDGKKKPTSPFDFPKTSHVMILKQIYTVEPFFSYSKLITAIVSAMDKNGCRLGQSKAREFVTYYMTEKLIKQESVNGMPYKVYVLS